MNEPGKFWLVFTLLAAWPLVLVGLFAFARRFPSGLRPHKLWIFWAALPAIYVPACVYFFSTGETGRGASFLAFSIGAAAQALHLRRQATVRPTPLADR